MKTEIDEENKKNQLHGKAVANTQSPYYFGFIANWKCYWKMSALAQSMNSQNRHIKAREFGDNLRTEENPSGSSDFRNKFFELNQPKSDSLVLQYCMPKTDELAGLSIIKLILRYKREFRGY